MMDESLHGEFRVSLLDLGHDERRRAARLPRTVWASSVLTFDRAAHQGSSLWTSPIAPFTGWPARRGETRHIAPLAAIRRIVVAMRLWRERARARQQLRQLNDHLLRDVGLRREHLGYESTEPFWHCD
jgi:uncharacterized protein YjiS (DUF1127 family)